MDYKFKKQLASQFLNSREARLKDTAEEANTSMIKNYPETKKFVRSLPIKDVFEPLYDVLMVPSQDFASLSLEYPLYSKELMLIHELKELAPGIFRIYEMYVSHKGDKHYISIKFESFKQDLFEKAVKLVDDFLSCKL